MIVDLKKDLSVLNIFRHEYKMVKRLIRDTSPTVNHLFMLSTGNKQVYKKILAYSKKFSNVTVYFQSFPEINFSAFRNDCLSKAKINTPYYMWLDSDERLQISEPIHFESDILNVKRIDASNKFTTTITRIFKTDLEGKWKNIIHENFDCSACSVSDLESIKILHLTSEMKRSQHKKRLYFNLLNKQIAMCDSEVHKFNLICLKILMLSHDLKQPKKCIEVFNTHREFIMSSAIKNESVIFYFDMLLHVILSMSRLQLFPDQNLMEECESFATCKSSFFQLVRALSFNQKMCPNLKIYFEYKYNLLENEIEPFNNKDYLQKDEIQKLLRKLNNVKPRTNRQTKKIQNRKNR